MKRFTCSGRRSISDSNLYAALALALTIPDICGSLESPGPGKSEKRYTKWFEQWAQPKFTALIGPQREKHVYINAADCFQLRCSLIHSGSSEIDSKKVKKLRKAEFCDPTVGSHMNSFGDWIQLRADEFSAAMFDAADEWDLATQSDQLIQQRKTDLLFIHSKGAVIRGVKFG